MGADALRPALLFTSQLDPAIPTPHIVGERLIDKTPKQHNILVTISNG